MRTGSVSAVLVARAPRNSLVLGVRFEPVQAKTVTKRWRATLVTKCFSSNGFTIISSPLQSSRVVETLLETPRLDLGSQLLGHLEVARHTDATVTLDGFAQKLTSPAFVARRISLDEHLRVPAADLGLLELVR